MGSLAEGGGAALHVPGVLWTGPFVVLLLAIAVLPLISGISHWWEKNRNKLVVSVLLAAVITLYYALRGYGVHGSGSGAAAAAAMLRHAILQDYIPFIVLLFSLYAISGGIRLTGDVPAHPFTNCAILLGGAILASLIGTTGASMLLIRPLLQINSERSRVTHTVIFFIFLVSNIGGALLPVGDPPLFLGYLRGVPFFWTLHLAPQWIFAILVLLVLYLVFDLSAYRREAPKAIALDEAVRTPVRVEGKRNFLLLGVVVAAVALILPDKPLPGTNWIPPAHLYLRELVELFVVALSFAITPSHIRKANNFDFGPITEVACLFVGVFITMQAPLEIMRLEGASLGITHPAEYFWATGLLSSFLDNAPTYTVFFELGGAVHTQGVQTLHGLATATGGMAVSTLAAITAGAVFMGANTYIGNGPNFLVRGIAERHGVRMPSFFGYMVWSVLILEPLFLVVTAIFFR